MGKRPVSILKRERAVQQDQRPAKRAKTAAAQQQQARSQRQPRNSAGGGGASRPSQPQGLRPISAVHLQAANAVRRLLDADARKKGGVSLKSLTLAPHITAKKATYAVTIEALKHLPVLQPLLERTQLAEGGQGLSQATALVLAYELLFGQGLRPTGPAERAVLQRRADLKEGLQLLLDDAGVQSAAELLPRPGPDTPHPRTARVNTIKMSVAAALAWLADPPPEHRKWAAVGRQAALDPLLPDLLAFPPSTDLHDHPLVESGALVLQSKASCMPAVALAPRPGWTVVDACAAPGNKTTQLAALMANRGAVVAFEKDAKRLERLQHNAAASGGTCIAPQLADFLGVDPEEERYRDVQAVLLDPSCSGSGTSFSRMDFLLPSFADRLRGQAAIEHVDERVEALARFQQAAVLHALRFPALRRLVYSTCSVHARENEAVVAAVLPEATARGFRLEAAFPSWPRRGVPGLVEGAERLVRVDADEDGTEGFFLAVFAKAEDCGTQPKQHQSHPIQQQSEQQQQRRQAGKKKAGRQKTAASQGG